METATLKKRTPANGRERKTTIHKSEKSEMTDSEELAAGTLAMEKSRYNMALARELAEYLSSGLVEVLGDYDRYLKRGAKDDPGQDCALFQEIERTSERVRAAVLGIACHNPDIAALRLAIFKLSETVF